MACARALRAGADGDGRGFGGCASRRSGCACPWTGHAAIPPVRGGAGLGADARDTIGRSWHQHSCARHGSHLRIGLVTTRAASPQLELQGCSASHHGAGERRSAIARLGAFDRPAVAGLGVGGSTRRVRPRQTWYSGVRRGSARRGGASADPRLDLTFARAARAGRIVAAVGPELARLDPRRASASSERQRCRRSSRCRLRAGSRVVLRWLYGQVEAAPGSNRRARPSARPREAPPPSEDRRGP